MSTPETSVTAGTTKPAGEDISDDEAVAEVAEQTSSDQKAEDVFEREAAGASTDEPVEEASFVPGQLSARGEAVSILEQSPGLQGDKLTKSAQSRFVLMRLTKLGCSRSRIETNCVFRRARARVS